jgi:DNA end-binding protein Ku
MAARPSWKGFLKLSLVSCPVELYNATTRAKMVSFHLVHPKTHNRIQMKPYDPDLGLVERKDLVRGYEVEKGRYVIVDDEELEKVRLESTKTIDVAKFVDDKAIDPLYWDTPYFLVPDGPMAVEAYSVIREAMREEGRTALGRVVLSHRERTVAIRPRGKGMLAVMLRYPEEVRKESEFFEDIEPPKKIDHRMVDIASKIIEQSSGEFDPADFEDRYEVALRELVTSRSREVETVSEEPKATNVVDLMDALKASLRRRNGTGTRERSAAPPARGRSHGHAPRRKRASR